VIAAECGRVPADAANSARQINGLIAKPLAGNEFYFDPGRAANPGVSMCTERIVAIELPTLSVGTPYCPAVTRQRADWLCDNGSIFGHTSYH
jgi:hypothetical protein